MYEVILRRGSTVPEIWGWGVHNTKKAEKGAVCGRGRVERGGSLQY
jgi:hypothetical protein